MVAPSCRFYKPKYPEIEEVVVANVHSIAEMGAYVSLLEYDNVEGMILLSELSRRRIRSVNKLIRVGRNECVVVIRVDKEKGYIDLSKRRANAEDIAACEEKFSKGKAVNSIIWHVANLLKFETKEEVEDLYEKVAWCFETKYKRLTAPYEVFRSSVADPSVFDECDVSDEVKRILLEQIRLKLTPQAVKIRTDIEVSCYTYEGINSIKAALKKGLECSSESIPVKINLIAPPLYMITTSTLDRNLGLQALHEICEVINQTITSLNGNFVLKMPPTVVTDNDEVELKKQMERLEAANAEVDGDEDEDEEHEEEEDGDDEEEERNSAENLANDEPAAIAG